MAAKDGDRVRVHYTGKLGDGSVFDSSSGRDPLEFTVGEGLVISGFENAVRGMDNGESKTVEIPVDDAYGKRRDELVLVVEKNQFPDGADPEVGQEFQLQQEEGNAVPVRVTEVEGDQVTLDANHPLAGEDLSFEIELVEIL